MKKNYDMIASLGGNCAAASQLRMRGLRLYSLPFDWLYMKDSQTIEWIADNFSRKFDNLMLQENLVPIPEQDLHGGGTAPFGYKDTISGYGFIHHFFGPKDNPAAFNSVKAKMSRRVARFFSKLEEAESILFILATNFSYDENLADNLAKTIRNLYPNKVIDFHFMQFRYKFSDCTQTARESIDEHLSKCCYAREIGDYDFEKTSSEWAFLDNVVLKDEARCCLGIKDKFLYKIWKHISKYFLNKGYGCKGVSFGKEIYDK